MRRWRLTLLAVMFVGFFLVVGYSPSARAVSYSPGLKPGDTASYSLYHHADNFGSQMRVLSVSGTTVTANFQDYPSYGIVLGTMHLDIFSGVTNSSVSSLYFAVAPGLIVGDPIFDGSSISVTAQQNYSCGAGGQQRPQVYATIPVTGEYVRISWDESTGLMCNYQANYSNNGTVALGLILAGTSIWGPQSSGLDPFVYGQVLPSAFGLVLVVLVLFVYFRKRRPKAKPRSK